MHTAESYQLPPDSILLMASSDVLQAWYRITLTAAHPHEVTAEFEPDIAAIRDARLREDFPVLHAACRQFTHHVANGSHRYLPEIVQAATALDHAIADLGPHHSPPRSSADPSHHTTTPAGPPPHSTPGTT